MPDASIPGDIVESIAVSNVKSVGEQPSILSNLALANEIANVNMTQQNLVNQQQILYNLSVVTAAKSVEIIAGINTSGSSSTQTTQ